jgi:hypothetical protein
VFSFEFFLKKSVVLLFQKKTETKGKKMQSRAGMADKPGRPGRPLAFGEPDHVYAVNKQDGQVTLNMKELQEQMHENGDYKLVHAYEKEKPNPRAKAALEKVRHFENSQEFFNSALNN